MKLTASIEDAAPYLLSKPEMRRIGRAAIEASGKLWHYLFKPLHFQIEAFSRYGYRGRGKKYEAMKARRYPQSGGRPLVLTGESERLALSAAKVYATAKDFAHYSADVTVSAPHLNFHKYEMTKVTPEEQDQLQAQFAKVFADGVVDAWKSRGLSSRKIELGRQALAGAA